VLVRKGHLRLVWSRKPLLSIEHLRHFETPKTWAEIRELEPRMKMSRWRAGIIDADELGFGFLMWLPAVRTDPDRPGAWVLTEKGRKYVAARTNMQRG